MKAHELKRGQSIRLLGDSSNIKLTAISFTGHELDYSDVFTSSDRLIVVEVHADHSIVSLSLYADRRWVIGNEWLFRFEIDKNIPLDLGLRNPSSNKPSYQKGRLPIKIKKLRPDAFMPQYASAGAACFDLHAVWDFHKFPHTMIRPEDSEVFGTGLAFEIPEGHVMLVFSRSGHGFNHDIRLANCVGVIDSDYRGEVKVKLTNDSLDMFKVNHGDRIAQAMIIPIPAIQLVEVDELSTTVRGEHGAGSTGR